MIHLLCLMLITSLSYSDTGVMMFKVMPQDAKVYVNGVLKGKAKTLSMMEMKPGRYSVKIKKSTRNIQKSYKVKSGAITRVTLNLDDSSVSKANENKHIGFFEVNTIPEGMEIYLSGTYHGLSPIKKVKVKSGPHKLEIKDPKNLYKKLIEVIQVKHDVFKPLKIQMKPGVAKLIFLGNESGKVLVNGFLTNVEVPGVLMMPTGKYLVEIAGKYKGYNRTFELKNGEELEVKYTLSSNKKIDIVKDTKRLMNMIKIPSGSFVMGSPKTERRSDKDERPLHSVTISKPFLMGKYEVTQKIFQMIMGFNPSEIKGDNLPVSMVSWTDVRHFLNVLNKRVDCKKPDTLNLVEKYGVDAVPKGCFRLPTEAEWEYAARAGSKTAFSFGASIDFTQARFDSKYPYGGGQKGVSKNTPAPVGSYKPNAFGLYDMHGNVWEWCHDWYDKSFYTKSFYKGSKKSNPVNIEKEYKRVTRGGGWRTNGRYLRSANRDKIRADHRGVGYGFRLVAVE